MGLWHSRILILDGISLCSLKTDLKLKSSASQVWGSRYITPTLDLYPHNKLTFKFLGKEESEGSIVQMIVLFSL